MHCNCADLNTESVVVSALLRKSPNGFGMTMSGYHPVYIQAVQEGELIFS